MMFNRVVLPEPLGPNIDVNSFDKNEEEVKNANGESFSERVAKVKIQMDGFKGSELFRTLTKLHVAPVRSPIRKTNVILKNPNFQKAEELWNYITIQTVEIPLNIPYMDLGTDDELMSDTFRSWESSMEKRLQNTSTLYKYFPDINATYCMNNAININF